MTGFIAFVYVIFSGVSTHIFQTFSVRGTSTRQSMMPASML